jgi:antimicrobial peptide system SdpB family protein
LFELSSAADLPAARWCAILILAAVVIGWRPRITGVLHWWVSLSFSLSCAIVDGGDQVATVLTTLLVPVTLTDPRKWHWSAPPALKGKAAALVAGSAFTVIRLQVAAIYFHAAVGKIGVEEWANGTAVYYWFTHPVFGLNQSLLPLLLPVLVSPWGVVLFTWGAMLLEVVLFTGLVADRRWWPMLLWLGLAFHFGILIIHGLMSFFFAMAGALILYLRPRDRPFALSWQPLRMLARLGDHRALERSTHTSSRPA